MFLCKQDAMEYINKNKSLLLSGLNEMEMKTIYSDEHMSIMILRNKNKLIKMIGNYSDGSITGIFKEMIDSGLIG